MVQSCDFLREFCLPWRSDRHFLIFDICLTASLGKIILTKDREQKASKCFLKCGPGLKEPSHGSAHAPET